MFDGIIGMYFPENAVFYEFGTGVSTKKSDVWSQRGNISKVIQSGTN